MRVMLSGITNWDEASKAIAAGFHSLGFVLEPKSPRYINPETAREIILRLPPFVGTVGVFANTPRYVIHELVTFCRLDWLLFLGNETSEECLDYHQPVIKFLPRISQSAQFSELNALLLEEDEARQVLKTGEQPYIIAKGVSSILRPGSLDGLYFTLDEKGTIDGVSIEQFRLI